MRRPRSSIGRSTCGDISICTVLLISVTRLEVAEVTEKIHNGGTEKTKTNEEDEKKNTLLRSPPVLRFSVVNLLRYLRHLWHSESKTHMKTSAVSRRRFMKGIATSAAAMSALPKDVLGMTGTPESPARTAAIIQNAK